MLDRRLGIFGLISSLFTWVTTSRTTKIIFTVSFNQIKLFHKHLKRFQFR